MRLSLNLIVVVPALLLATCAFADFSFDEMEQLERSEQGELLQRAREAANAENFGAARDVLKRAGHKAYAPDDIKAVEGLIAQREAAVVASVAVT